jgi:hypothetical protein
MDRLHDKVELFDAVMKHKIIVTLDADVSDSNHEVTSSHTTDRVTVPAFSLGQMI